MKSNMFEVCFSVSENAIIHESILDLIKSIKDTCFAEKFKTWIKSIVLNFWNENEC